jgi:hypothetical protein
MKKLKLVSSIAFLSIIAILLACDRNIKEPLALSNLKGSDVFTFSNEKKDLSSFSSLLNYTKFKAGELKNETTISFIAERANKEDVSYQVIKNSEGMHISAQSIFNKNDNSSIEFNTKLRTLSLKYGEDEVVLTEKSDLNKLSSIQYKLLLNAIAITLETTDFDLNQKTQLLKKTRVQQTCGFVGVGFGKSIASSRSSSQSPADQCTCSKSQGTDCGCAWGDFLCVCVTWKECSCSNGMCGDLQ